MDPEIAALAGTAGTTVVTLMVTNAWESARDGMVALWRRFQPARAESVGEELEAGREELLLARPDVADELRVLLDELAPAMPEEPDARHVHLRARASGSARIYQAGRDQHITER